MAQPLDLPLPPNLALWDSCVVRVTAVDATTGAVVSGVNVSNVSMQVTPVAGATLDSGSFKTQNPVLLRTKRATTGTTAGTGTTGGTTTSGSGSGTTTGTGGTTTGTTGGTGGTTTGTTGGTTGTAAAPQFLCDFELQTPQPWSPMLTPQSHNYGNQTDTAHACFGDWFLATDPDPTGAGNHVSKIVLDRYNGTSPTQRVNLIAPGHSLAEGDDWYYGLKFYIPSPGLFSKGLGCDIWELNSGALFPTIALYYRELNGAPDHLAIAYQTGKVVSGVNHYHSDPDFPSSNPARIELPGLLAIPRGQLRAGVWNEIILRVRMSDETHLAGAIQCWWRTRGQSSWRLTADTTTGGYPPFPTIGYNNDGSVPSSCFEGMALLYRPSAPNIPTIYHDDLSRSSSFAAAASV